MSFPQAQEFITSGGIREYDNESEAPYAFKGKDWISYDDDQSLTTKSLWIKANSYAGVMTWNLNCDDWTGNVSGEKFYLHKVINKNVI